jgi:mannose-6-phosphate isomerase-like protein (cupin superfamily)
MAHATIRTPPKDPARRDRGRTGRISGQTLSMRLWDHDTQSGIPRMRSLDRETAGFVIAGRATLEIEGDSLPLRPGDCWLVPAGRRHCYLVEDGFRAVEISALPEMRPGAVP